MIIKALSMCKPLLMCNDEANGRFQFMQYSGLILLVIAVQLLSGCSSSEDTAVTNKNSAPLTGDLATARALYFDKRVPDDFYKENNYQDIFYSISHVKNTSLLPVSARAGMTAYDLASDDFIEAMSWSEKAAEHQVSYQQLSANKETLLYFQFSRFDPSLPEFINMHRVFKASVLDRTGVDRNDEDGHYRGRITMTELTADKVKMIIEYLWMFTQSNNYKNAVLQSYTIETDNEYIHIMKQARLQMNYSANSCDDIDVFEVRYTVPKASGFIWREKQLTHRFSAKRSANHLEICHT